MGKMGEFRKCVKLLGVLQLICIVSCSTSSTNLHDIGKAAKGRLYTLRSKLQKERVPMVTEVNHDEGGGKRIRVYSNVKYNEGPHVPRKESRGYSFHHTPGEIKNPMFSSGSYSSRDFHSRMGKVSGGMALDGVKWKSPDKKMDKYMKYAYKVDGGSQLNSFNIHQIEMKNGTKGKAPAPIVISTTSERTTTTTTSTPSSPFSMAMGSLDIAKLGQGLNSAMTSVLTHKLMGIIDQEIPQGFLMPLKHLVSSGEKMVEFWDKKKTGRDGDGKPGIVEMFGYGIEQLKRYRDGQIVIEKADPVHNMTSASRAMVQGMMVVKKLTNRVLGYDTEVSQVESRGGYDHGGGWGWGHHMSYGHYLDPYAILATLGFGVFLFNVIFNLLNNAPGGGVASGRSLDVQDIDIPLVLSDIVSADKAQLEEKIFGTPTIRTKRSATGEDDSTPYFNSVVDKLEGMYRTYKTVTGNPTCGRLYLCRAAIQDAFQGDDGGSDASLYSQLYTIGLGQLSGDPETQSVVKSIKSRVAKGEDVNCEMEFKGCEE